MTSNNKGNLVTIGLCLKNCEATMEETIKGILSQDFPHDQMEIIVVDDGCCDKTISIVVEGLSSLKEQLRMFCTGGKGLGTARQTVVENANSKYIIWVDGDMILPKDHVRKQIDFAEKNPNIGKARGKWQRLQSENLVSLLEEMRLLNYDVKDVDGSMSNLVGIGGSICRVDALKQVGGFDRDIKGSGEDIDIAARMMKAGWLLCLSEAEFYHKFRESWKGLWDQFYWYGCGAHFLSHKHKNLIPLWEMIPPVAFISGLRLSLIAYKKVYKKVAFLLPLQYFYKQVAWCLGFARSHLNGYGHHNSTKSSKINVVCIVY
jgi:glycosyltransferase involved in cell wall biosynthesis